MIRTGVLKNYFKVAQQFIYDGGSDAHGDALHSVQELNFKIFIGSSL
ncbi:hypothetical protein Tamer19_66090 [Cupriavidus sp. TA19]|nr:hypothetical protein Tamer19_66090 [Cupriavidus sp. TA19]